MVIAECDTGKTLISLGAIHVHSRGSPSTALAMAPPHLVEKRVREAFLTLAGFRIFLIDDLRNCGDDNNSHGVNVVRLRQGRIVCERWRTTLSALRSRTDSPSSRKRCLWLCKRPSLFIVGRERTHFGLGKGTPRHRPHCATHGRALSSIDPAGCITVTIELPSPRVFRLSLMYAQIYAHHARARYTGVRRRRKKSPAHSRNEMADPVRARMTRSLHRGKETTFTSDDTLATHRAKITLRISWHVLRHTFLAGSPYGQSARLWLGDCFRADNSSRTG
jgi:hypothetical protein